MRVGVVAGLESVVGAADGEEASPERSRAGLAKGDVAYRCVLWDEWLWQRLAIWVLVFGWVGAWWL